jgi:metallo-beta-lactamase family protein
VDLRFFGAAQEITGSCSLLETNGMRLLVDCGLHQGRGLADRNWKPFPFDPSQIDILIITHVHLDHSGLIPKLVREGFKGQILATIPSGELLPIVLADSARIQEEDAAYKKKRHKKEGRKGKYPEVPLYTVEDAKRTYHLIRSIPYFEPFKLSDTVTLIFHEAGHILGSAMVELRVHENGEERKIVFSGDIGQRDKPLMRDPSVFENADYVVMESTYGDRIHIDREDVVSSLSRVINQTARRGGNIVIPTFAIERAQEVMYHLSRLVRQDKIPFLMVFLDSPMAVEVTEVFQRHENILDEETRLLIEGEEEPFRFPGLRFVRSVEQSKAINTIRGSCVIMAGSGMCTGGRIKHHLKHNISRPESTILFVGYQARGTLGRKIIDGSPDVRIHGKLHPVKADIQQILGFSGHADRNGLLEWLSHFRTPPRAVFLTHGEKDSAESLAEYLKKKEGWKIFIPKAMDLQKLD